MRLTVRRRLERLEAKLLSATPRRLFDAPDWARDVPAAPGVYALWDTHTRTVAYVGETASLRHRMHDLGRSVNHTCRRKIAGELGLIGVPESELSLAMGKRYLISTLPVDFGRAELEEYLTLRWRETILNSPGKRLHRGGRYAWVEPSLARLPAAVVRAARLASRL